MCSHIRFRRAANSYGEFVIRLPTNSFWPTRLTRSANSYLRGGKFGIHTKIDVKYPPGVYPRPQPGQDSTWRNNTKSNIASGATLSLFSRYRFEGICYLHWYSITWTAFLSYEWCIRSVLEKVGPLGPSSNTYNGSHWWSNIKQPRGYFLVPNQWMASSSDLVNRLGPREYPPSFYFVLYLLVSITILSVPYVYHTI